MDGSSAHPQYSNHDRGQLGQPSVLTTADCPTHSISKLLATRFMRALIWIGAAIGIAVFFPAVGAFMLGSPFLALVIFLIVILAFLGEEDQSTD